MKATSTDKSFRYKNWYCKWNPLESLYCLYTPDEMEQPSGFRYNEWECETKEDCKVFINSY
jgi:hypothetical protein